VLAYSAEHRWCDAIENFSRVFPAQSRRVADALRDRCVLIAEHLGALHGLSVGRGLFGGLLVNCVSATGPCVRRERGGDRGYGNIDRLLGNCRVETKPLAHLLSGARCDLLLN
jgi:hypothetical protein